ncbi:hypothetical protein [Sporosarcina sp. NPDC096371]|uniref:hypothetical protein n=1 Tax=Sporosarcina sp. NPDC096371 TaxID=3364530 RepID=UPI0037FE2FF7
MDETILIDKNMHDFHDKQYPLIKLKSDLGEPSILVSWAFGKGYFGLQVDIPLMILGQDTDRHHNEEMTDYIVSLANRLFESTPFFFGFANHEHELDTSIDQNKVIETIQSLNPSLAFVPKNGTLQVEYGKYTIDGLTPYKKSI